MKAGSSPCLVILTCLISLGIETVFAVPAVFRGNGDFIGPVIPARPVFGKNLTSQFLSAAAWEKGTFDGPWEKAPSLEGEISHQMTAMPILFGAIPDSVRVHQNEGGRVNSMTICYLDAGTYFGYRSGGEKGRELRQEGDLKRAEFGRRFREVADQLQRTLEAGCGTGTLAVIGKSELLRNSVLQYHWQDFYFQLIKSPEQFVSIRITFERKPERDFLDPEAAKLSHREREEFCIKNVKSNDRGDVHIEGVPIFTQGVTPYCGVHTLAMTASYFGLRAPLETLVAGADFQNTGSARGSNTLGLYHSVAEEIGMGLSNSSRFEAKRVEKSIASGIPVIIWRRVDLEREKAHLKSEHDRADTGQVKLPVLSEKALALLPERSRKGTPSHASVVTGINIELGEVILTEPWGEFARGRRIRVEELEATTYAAFYFKF